MRNLELKLINLIFVSITEDMREICEIAVKSHIVKRVGGWDTKWVWKKGRKNKRGESGKPNNRPAPTSVSVRSSSEKEKMKWTIRLTGIYILSCAICVSELCRVTVRRIRSGKSVIITRARRSPKRTPLPSDFRSFSHAFFSLPFCAIVPSFVPLAATWQRETQK